MYCSLAASQNRAYYKNTSPNSFVTPIGGVRHFPTKENIMGCSFQLLGSQPDPTLQEQAITYMSRTRALVYNQDVHKSRISEGTPLQLVNQLEFHDENEALVSLSKHYQGFCTYSHHRFRSLDRYFMFDNEHDGMICSVAWPYSEREFELNWNCTWVGAGQVYRSVTSDLLPLDAVLFYVLKKRIIPNLSIHDDYNIYRNFFLNWEHDPKNPLRKLQKEDSIEQLVQESAAFFHDHTTFLKEKEREREERVRIQRERARPRTITLIHDVDLYDLELSVRTTNALHNAKIYTLQSLVGMSMRSLLKLPNFGRKSLYEVNKRLSDYNISLPLVMDEKP
jgi:hypothetical protein